jgi:hypothetical protein
MVSSSQSGIGCIMWELIELQHEPRSQHPLSNDPDNEYEPIAMYKDERGNETFDFDGLWEWSTHKYPAYPKKLLQLVQKCLSFDPADRPRLDDLQRSIMYELRKANGEEVDSGKDVVSEQDTHVRYKAWPHVYKIDPVDWTKPGLGIALGNLDSKSLHSRFGIGQLLSALPRADHGVGQP